MKKKPLTEADFKIADAIRNQRLIVGMTQAQLAGALSIAAQLVQKYETCRSRIDASRLYYIAHAMQVPIGRLFEGLDGIGGDEAVDGLSKDAVRLARDIDALSPAERRRALELCRACISAFRKEAVAA